MRIVRQCGRASLPVSLKRGSMCAIAFLVLVSAATPPAASAGIKVTVPSVPPNPTAQFLRNPQHIYVLAIGIDRYTAPGDLLQHPNSGLLSNLQYSVADAESVANVFHGIAWGLQPMVLTGAAATKAAIRNAIQQIASKSNANDLFILSFSGHAFTAKLPDGNQESYQIGRAHV